ncbi:endo-1,4-beta-xylanase [Algoriphagus aestuariicola]|uniref:Beta-xylanase n=1 Tax=Algoriphagus aestuariicola TaxID=1852016 RepID=A0ABS3BLA2_9BACT|nr:endo-1,4-beta-xylanase [Algoriphagus aestuariicola]MBN7800083.1 endo-1,4-beta-xylanase [Algoriphagus aestuariicola]
MFLICFVPALLCFSQEENKRQIEEKLLLEAKSNIEKHRKGNAQITVLNAQGEPESNMKIEINQISHDFLFGNLSEEVFRPELTDSERTKFTEMFTGLFNFTELTVKWAPYEPQQGKPEWEKLQEKLDWCFASGVVPKGHTLGWTHDAGTPEWLYHYSPEEATQLYEARIKNLVGGFRDQITSWDVINEPVTTIPWELALLDTVGGQNKIDDGIRYKVDGITLNQTIPWVENSYRWAYEANPDGDFIINEFYTIAKPEIREKYFNLITELLQREVPVTGIGIQGHEPREMWFSPVELVATFDKFQELGLPLHITEFTPQSSGKTITGWREGVWTEEAQAEFAEQFYTLAFGHPAMASIHWWGLSDRFIWLKSGGLIDRDFNPKPVYHRLKKLIKEDWMTKGLQLTSDQNGQVDFRGFFGKYELTLTDSEGSICKKEIHLNKNASVEFVIVYDNQKN